MENTLTDLTSRRLTRTIRLAALSPGVLVCASAIRLLVIANYDPTTASSIAAANGVVGTLLGTLIPVIPQLLPALLLLFIALRKPLLLAFAAIGTVLVAPAYTTLQGAWNRTEQMLLAVGHTINEHNRQLQSHMVSMLWRQDRAALIFGAIVVLVIVIDNREKIFGSLPGDRFNVDAWDKALSIATTAIVGLIPAAILTAVFGLMFFFTTIMYQVPTTTSEISSITSKPWLPSEVVILKNGTTQVGYTLSDDNGWFVFLQENNRTIDYFHSADVLSRTLCRLVGEQRSNRPPLVKLINAPAPHVLPCPGVK